MDFAFINKDYTIIIILWADFKLQPEAGGGKEKVDRVCRKFKSVFDYKPLPSGQDQDFLSPLGGEFVKCLGLGLVAGKSEVVKKY
jgi:hypothetical protein